MTGKIVNFTHLNSLLFFFILEIRILAAADYHKKCRLTLAGPWSTDISISKRFILSPSIVVGQFQWGLPIFTIQIVIFHTGRVFRNARRTNLRRTPDLVCWIQQLPSEYFSRTAYIVSTATFSTRRCGNSKYGLHIFGLQRRCCYACKLVFGAEKKSDFHFRRNIMNKIDLDFFSFLLGFAQLDYIPRLMWQAQIRGNKNWTVSPTPECDMKCSSFSFYVEPGDAVLIDTRIWYHGTSVAPGQFSMTIQSEYGWF